MVAVFPSIDLLQARRPWLSLYGVWVKPTQYNTRQRAAEGEDGADGAEQEQEEEIELALIQRMLPDEIMLLLFQRLGPYALGRCACVCRQWRLLTEHPRLWERACRDTFTPAYRDFAVSPKALLTQYRGSWRRVFLTVPHLRCDGLYVSRNTYLRQGAVEWRRTRTVHLVVYFRYFRFLPDGSLLYRTSPSPIAKVAKSMSAPVAANASGSSGGASTSASAAASGKDGVFSGRYVVRGGAALCVVTYPNSRSTEIRSRLRIRSTHTGANNRLDVERLFTFDKDLGMALGDSNGQADPESEPAAGAGQTEVKRGLSSFVFVPWEAVQTSELNLPISEMDFYMPG